MSVYFIQCGGPDGAIKIGTTIGDPMARLAAMQTGNPEPLRLLCSIAGGPDVEAAMHKRFAALRLRGEWFRADPLLLGFVDGLRYMTPQPESPSTSRPHEVLGLSVEQMSAIAGFVEADRLKTRSLDFLAETARVEAPLSAALVSEATWLRDELTHLREMLSYEKVAHFPGYQGSALALPVHLIDLRLQDIATELARDRSESVVFNEEAASSSASTELN